MLWLSWFLKIMLIVIRPKTKFVYFFITLYLFSSQLSMIAFNGDIYFGPHHTHFNGGACCLSCWVIVVQPYLVSSIGYLSDIGLVYNLSTNTWYPVCRFMRQSNSRKSKKQLCPLFNHCYCWPTQKAWSPIWLPFLSCILFMGRSLRWKRQH